MIVRPRRLRSTPAMRALVAETRIHPSQLVLPMFVAEGLDAPRPISSLPGVVQHTVDSLVDEVRRSVTLGLGGVMLFGVPRPEDKDAVVVTAETASKYSLKASGDLAPVASQPRRPK